MFSIDTVLWAGWPADGGSIPRKRIDFSFLQVILPGYKTQRALYSVGIGISFPVIISALS
jgi:hypothetical protein